MGSPRRRDLRDCDDDIAKLYLKTMAVQLVKMESLTQGNFMGKVQRLAHKLAGASDFLGVHRIATLMCDAERAAARHQSQRTLRLLSAAKTTLAVLHGRRLDLGAARPVPCRIFRRPQN